MGYTTTEKCYEDMNLPQTPENIKAVRVRAGLTVSEAAYETGIRYDLWVQVEAGAKTLPDKKWRDYIEFAGRRVFDANE
jgi:hypothetical protein